jgi:hypothetical protein
MVSAKCDLRTDFIQIPLDVQPLKLQLLNYGGFPEVVGILDGTHISIYCAFEKDFIPLMSRFYVDKIIAFTTLWNAGQGLLTTAEYCPILP